MVKKRYLSLNAMDQLLRKSGALRVADNAKEALAEVLQEKALKIGEQAKRMAEHAGRKTVIDKDIHRAMDVE